jgi:hypothetical protein
MRTGGFSSKSSPRVGFALRFAKTPSFCPLPTTLPLGACVLKTGSCVTRLCTPIRTALLSSSSPAGSGCPRISRCRSSRPSLSSSSSESVSKVSASVRSASAASGSSASRRWGAPFEGDEARLWKDGGGDVGTWYGVEDWTSASSWSATCV